MKGKWHIAGLMILLAAGLTGCGQQNTAGNPGTVSSGTVSAEVVTKTVDWYANSSNSYEVSEGEYAGDDPELLVQKKLDGTEVRTYGIKGLYELGRVTDQWIYYVVEREDDLDEENCSLAELWRVPVEKGNEGDHLLLEKKELLLSGYHMNSSLYVADDYIMYLVEEDDEEKRAVYRYDLQTKQSVPLMDGKKMEEAELVWGRQKTQGPMILQDQLFLAAEHNLYAIEPDSGRWKQIYQDESQDISIIVREKDPQGQYFYFSDNEQIYRYHAGAEKAELFLSRTVIREKLEELGLWGKKGRYEEGCICDIMAYRDYLYLDVSVSWKQRMRLDETSNEELQGKMLDWECSRTILLKISPEHPAELVHESAVADYFESHSNHIDREKLGYEYIEDSAIGGLSPEKGEILLICNGSRYFFDTLSYAAYDLTTGKIRKVKREDGDRERGISVNERK